MVDVAMSVPNCDSPEAKRVWDALRGVPDPEIPVVSVVELGMIAAVDANERSVTVKLTPTFAACPAIEHIHDTIRGAVTDAGFAHVNVETVYDPPWTTDRITAAGRAKLKSFGLAPPGCMNGRSVEPEDLLAVACPLCDSTDTTLESAFGPTLCRSIHYCEDCRQSFEHFKPVS